MDTSREIAVEKINALNFQKVDGVLYWTYPNSPSVLRSLELIQQLTIRDDDVLMIGYPRSGNHWVYETLNMILHQKTSFSSALFFYELLESLGDNMHEIIGKMSSPRILCTHNRIQRLPLQAIDKKIKIVYLARNPKDLLSSWYRLLSNFADPATPFSGTWDDFFQLQMSGDFAWGSWFDHILATETFIKANPNCPVYVLLYEEMKKDPVRKIKELCSFLGKPDILAEEIAQAVEFNNMKTNLMQGKLKITKLFVKKDDVFFKNGTIGDWKNQFTVAQSEKLNHIFNEKMAGSKIGALIQQYL